MGGWLREGGVELGDKGADSGSSEVPPYALDPLFAITLSLLSKPSMKPHLEVFLNLGYKAVEARKEQGKSTADLETWREKT